MPSYTGLHDTDSFGVHSRTLGYSQPYPCQITPARSKLLRDELLIVRLLVLMQLRTMCQSRLYQDESICSNLQRITETDEACQKELRRAALM